VKQLNALIKCGELVYSDVQVLFAFHL